jgi:hypothetical protein
MITQFKSVGSHFGHVIVSPSQPSMGFSFNIH